MKRFMTVVGLFAIGLPAFLATAGLAQVTIGPGLRADRPALSLKDLRDRNLVRQEFDFSCGAASLATLLRFGLGDEVTEAQILTEMFDSLSEDAQAIRRTEGFSLLDLQRVARARGYDAEGFRLRPEQLPILAGPVIVFIEARGYAHFAVLRGIHGDRAHLADPSRGNIRMPVYAFLDDWLQDDGRGIVFVVEARTGLPDQSTPLTLDTKGLPRPEIMTVREMLGVPNPVSAFLSR
jgi:predicted double-glycine peptidase